MTSLPDVPTIVGLRSRHVRDPAPAEEPTTSRPERMLARTMPVTSIALARILRTRLIAPSVRRLGASLTREPGQTRAGPMSPTASSSKAEGGAPPPPARLANAVGDGRAAHRLSPGDHAGAAGLVRQARPGAR